MYLYLQKKINTLKVNRTFCFSMMKLIWHTHYLLFSDIVNCDCNHKIFYVACYHKRNYHKLDFIFIISIILYNLYTILLYYFIYLKYFTIYFLISWKLKKYKCINQFGFLLFIFLIRYLKTLMDYILITLYRDNICLNLKISQI